MSRTTSTPTHTAPTRHPTAATPSSSTATRMPPSPPIHSTTHGGEDSDPPRPRIHGRPRPREGMGPRIQGRVGRPQRLPIRRRLAFRAGHPQPLPHRRRDRSEVPVTLTIYGQLEQGSTEWLEARAGILTASTIGQLITAKTIKPAMNDRSRGLCQTLIAERITGHVEPVFPNRAMTRGTLLEPEARRIYAEQTGRDVDEVGFARLDTDTYTLGSSPDGLVGETGGIEIKSPSAKVHVATVLSGAIPDYNRAQAQAFLH